ncbi:RagB/SusD family nutrient uptake outer membrane protein [uncultured Hymenobacter sp.]|uniref:RagB/SusD family nutrient uptake outer membrane protein n=1 Tax=uncultured Hymenobacter sp. TaxID=170016 RepID=UPI0035CABDE3
MRKKIAFFGLACALLASCDKDFLDLSPASQVGVTNFYRTSSDFTNAVNGAYSSLQAAGQYGEWYVFSEITSDNTTNPLSGSVTDQDEFDKFYVRSTNPFLDARWNNSYQGIARCNAILDRIDPITMPDALKTQYKGEARFLRALMYFNLVRVFGDVPLVVNEVKSVSEGYTQSRVAVDQVYEQIIRDLSEAETALPVRYTAAGDLGRATSNSAKALLGKVYLTRQNFAAAATKLKEVIDSRAYSLLPSYAEVFRAGNGNHAESVFAVQFKKGGLGEGSNYANNFAPEFSGTNVVPLGSTGGNNIVTPDVEAAYEAGDVRKAASMASSYTRPDGTVVSVRFTRKFLDVPAQNNDSDNDWPVIRYADVLLMYAEALNEQSFVAGGEAFTYLNQVRARAGLPAKTAANSVAALQVADQAAFRLAMEQERRVELAFEGHRWFDLVRTGRAIPVMNAHFARYNIRVGNRLVTIQPYQLLMPVPQNQINVNPGQITQNPGHVL